MDKLKLTAENYRSNFTHHSKMAKDKIFPNTKI